MSWRCVLMHNDGPLQAQQVKPAPLAADCENR